MGVSPSLLHRWRERFESQLTRGAHGRRSSSPPCAEHRSDPFSDRFPVFEDDLAAFDLVDASRDLFSLSLFDAIIRRSIQTCDQLARDFGTLLV